MINQPIKSGARDGRKGSSAPEQSQAASILSPQGASQQEEVLIRKRKRRKNKKKKWATAAIVVAVIAVLAGGGAFAVTRMIDSGKQAVTSTAENAAVDTAENAVTYDEGKTVTYNGHKYALNTNMVSVLVIGYDRETPAEEGEKAGQSDALIVLAMDTATGKATAINLPRDSMTLVDQYVSGTFVGTQTMQLCLAYSFGDGRESSCEITAKAASRLLYNIPISYYFALDLSGIGPLNDSIGGVALTPLQSIPSTNIVEGQDTVLFGTNARRYVQYRDTSVLTSSLDRQARQIQYVQAFSSQALSMAKGSVGSLVELYNTAAEYSITNLGLNEFSYLATSVVNSGITDLSMATLPGTMAQGEKYAEYTLDSAAVYETVLNTYYTRVD